MGLFSIINLLMIVLSGKANDVLLSFSHQDTGKNFSDHLYKALSEAGIRTFRDEDGIYRGKNSDIEIKKAIEESRISVVVFSKDYASSTRCLDQLVLIMNARRNTGLPVLPVFYKVDPSEEMYSEAFAKHEKSFHNEMGRVESWRAALEEAADLAGMVLQDSYESKFVESIVQHIANQLSTTSSMSPSSSAFLIIFIFPAKVCCANESKRRKGKRRISVKAEASTTSN